MKARLVHSLWKSRNPIADMPAHVWAQVERDEPRARPVPIRFPFWGQLAFACFWDTSTERQLGFGVGPIPHSKIREWAADHGLTGSLRHALEHVVRQMDGEYLRIEAARIEAERKRGRYG